MQAHDLHTPSQDAEAGFRCLGYKNLGRKMAARMATGSRTFMRVMSKSLLELACILTALLLDDLLAGGFPPWQRQRHLSEYSVFDSQQAFNPHIIEEMYPR